MKILSGAAVFGRETRTNIRYMALYFVTIGAFPGGPGFLSWAMNSEFFPDSVLTGGCIRDWTDDCRLGWPCCSCHHHGICCHSRNHWRYRRNVSISPRELNRSNEMSKTDQPTDGLISPPTHPDIRPATASTSAARSVPSVWPSLVSSTACVKTACGRLVSGTTVSRGCRRVNRMR